MVKKKKTEHKKTKEIKSKKVIGWQISTGVLTILLLVSIFVGNFNINNTQEEKTTILTSQEVEEKAIEYINKNILQGQGVATSKGVEESGDMYLIKLDVNGQTLDSYATKDGEMLFPQVINLNEELPTAEQTQEAPAQELTKSEKPNVELFVMSHCPYGTQMEKGILPVVKELEGKIDFELKFVNYAMHPTQGEVEEQLNQYCIQRDYNDKFLAYLGEFLESGNGQDALKEVGLTQADISQCVEDTDKEFNVIQNLEEKSSWLNGRFPKFMIHDDDNKKYGVQGSPSLVINGQNAQAGRDAQSILNAVCGAFTDAPEECNTDMTSFGNPAPGFGFDTQGGSATSAGCGA